MRRYWIEPQNLQGELVVFKDELFHHIFDVCRQDVGNHFEVLTADSRAFLVEVIEVNKKNATARIKESRVIPPLPRPHIHLALSLPRFPVMDAVVEKAVELGVKSIQPLFSDFSFIRKNDKLSTNKTERWDKIVKSATQQSGRGDLMNIAAPQELSTFVPKIINNPNTLGLFAYEGSSTLGIKQYLQEAKEKSIEIQDLWLVIGSEGGFSTQEVEEFKQAGLQPVTIGSQVLRVETACMALVSVLKYEFDQMC